MTVVRNLENLIQGWGAAAIILRLLFAVVIGIIVGLNRELKNRTAGIKTHVLVCVGSALATMSSEYAIHMFPGDGDVTRIAASVVSGVGFLGAGTIMVTGKKQIRGLTTAAGLWTCACSGISIGIGFVEGAVLATVITIFTLTMLDRLEIWIHKRSKTLDLYLEFSGDDGVHWLNQYLHEHSIRADSYNVTRSQSPEETPVGSLTVTAPDIKTRDQLLDDLRESSFILYSEEL